MTKLALVTLHYKNLSDTIGLLQSIKEARAPRDLHLLCYVVDNEGSPGLLKVIETDYPNVVIIKNGQNNGFAAGNNLGFSRAISDQADIIVAINNDVIVPKDFLERVLASPINKPDVGAVGGLIYFAPGFEFKKGYRPKALGKVVWYAGGKFDWDNILGQNDHVDEVDKGQFIESQDTDFITGALFITKAPVLKKIGLFDERYFMYLEDVDLCTRIKKDGLRLVFDPHIKVWHKVAQSSGIGSPLNDYFITRNRLLFGMKFARPRTQFALFREALRKLVSGTPAQKSATRDFFTLKFGPGSYGNSLIHPPGELA